jgi:hypothetical protein
MQLFSSALQSTGKFLGIISEEKSKQPPMKPRSLPPQLLQKIKAKQTKIKTQDRNDDGTLYLDSYQRVLRVTLDRNTLASTDDVSAIVSSYGFLPTSNRITCNSSIPLISTPCGGIEPAIQYINFAQCNSPNSTIPASTIDGINTDTYNRCIEIDNNNAKIVGGVVGGMIGVSLLCFGLHRLKKYCQNRSGYNELTATVSTPLSPDKRGGRTTVSSSAATASVQPPAASASRFGSPTFQRQG